MPTWIGSWEIAVLLIILMPVILAFIVVMIVLLSRSQSSRHSPAATDAPAPSGPVGVNQAAIQILEERYARGDIQRDEFMQRRQDLWSVTGPHSSPPLGPPAAPPPAL